MVGKADLERRCTKEELLLLKRLAPLPLHEEYASFFSVPRGGVAWEGLRLTDQEACDKALEHKKLGEFETAEDLWASVAASYPAHGDCWFQLALLLEMKDDRGMAAVCAAHAVYLGCNYLAEAERLRRVFSSYEGVISTLSHWQAKSTNVLSDQCYRYFAGDKSAALAVLATRFKNLGQPLMAVALGLAAKEYF